MMKRLLFAWLLMVLGWPEGAWAQGQSPGIAAAELFRWMGIFAAVLGIGWLVLNHWVLRNRLPRAFYHWAMLLGLFALPALALMGAVEFMFEETKTVASCNTCHVMAPFVEDMQDPHSATLAARHFRNKWIPEKQCYACHTTYGLHGTLAAKRDGFRHWLLYVTRSWNEPIRYAGAFPNVSCLACHDGTSAFQGVPAHGALLTDLRSDRVACTSCHGPPHPTPLERFPLLSSGLLRQATVK
ncbi:hypothetical protein RHBI111906_09270 [Rhodothermus bifroesti]|nr:hypothetical protein HRbin18_00919 [bacterium HR18]